MSLQQLMSQTPQLGQPAPRVQQDVQTDPDAAGGWIPIWRDLYAPVACRIEDASAAAIVQFARKELDITHEIFTFQGGIRVGMRVVNGGVNYLVLGVQVEPATGRIPTTYHFFAQEQRAQNQVQ